MRHPGSTFAPPMNCLTQRPIVLADIRLKVMTPMFGGGSRVGELDGTTPIRTPSVRGQLRFWWRACNARRMEESLEQLFQEESLIWGSAAKKGDTLVGPASIETYVYDVKIGQEVGVQDCPQFAVFPFRAGAGEVDEPNSNQQERVGNVGATFCLRLTASAAVINRGVDIEKLTRSAQQALWAWITFGGLGARTRRGCGSLRCMPYLPESAEQLLLHEKLFQPPAKNTLAWIGDNLKELVDTGSGLPLVPSLAGARVVYGVSSDNPTTAWQNAVHPMQSFRQGPDIGRNHGGGDPYHPGQSRWPEPSAVRGHGRISANQTDVEKHQYKRINNFSGKDFPRADLGLPILFQNMRGRNDASPTIEGRLPGFQRMASPVLLKCFAASGNSFYPIAVQLDAPHLWDSGAPPVQIRDNFAKKCTSLAMSPMDKPSPSWPWADRPPQTGGAKSARDAFMEYLIHDNDWTEVIP